MIEKILINKIVEAVSLIYGQTIDSKLVSVQKTRKEFTGDLTIVVFPFLKISKKSPEQTANDLGAFLTENLDEVTGFNVIKGFLNLEISLKYWLDFFNQNFSDTTFGLVSEKAGAPVVVEYSSPNTNKPLHLGHIRNNLLGFSVANLINAAGKNAIKVNLVNDRGIHICKSMLAWQKWGNLESPESSGLKGDHLVGKYYVMFDQHYKAEIAQLVLSGVEKERAEKEAPLIVEAQEMLRRWEAGDAGTRQLWEMMNGWVYAGFDETYRRMGVDFDKMYYESQTYLLGRQLVEEGLAGGVLFKKEDNSVWCDLTGDGLDEKLLLRADGTSVYMTQDLGTAQMRADEFHAGKLIYVVGNEQNYHFDVLKLILKKLGKPWADNILHLSYGMVELPQGRMKSREGTVVDADDLMEEMYNTAKTTTETLGKIDAFDDVEKHNLFTMISLGALKYYILKVDPKKTMLFNPEESIDFNGNTGPFIQYTHARIRSLFRKAAERGLAVSTDEIPQLILPKEKDLIKLLHDFPVVVHEAAENLSPAQVANYVYDMAKEFNQFYQEVPVLKEENPATIAFRLTLAGFVGSVIKTSMNLLGIEVPEKM